MEVCAECVAEGSWISVCGDGVEEGGVEDCRVGLAVGGIWSQEFEGCAKGLCCFLWCGFAGGFVLQFYCPDAGC